MAVKKTFGVYERPDKEEIPRGAWLGVVVALIAMAAVAAVFFL
jgi:hypothetical protein